MNRQANRFYWVLIMVRITFRKPKIIILLFNWLKLRQTTATYNQVIGHNFCHILSQTTNMSKVKKQQKVLLMQVFPFGLYCSIMLSTLGVTENCCFLVGWNTTHTLAENYSFFSSECCIISSSETYVSPYQTIMQQTVLIITAIMTLYLTLSITILLPYLLQAEESFFTS